MSFDLYQKKNISAKLRGSQRHRAPEVINITSIITLGLNQLYSNIQTSQQLPVLVPNPRGLTNDEGFFESKGNIILYKRYKLLECIGTGACSTVYTAEDQLTRRIVALKAIRKNYEVIATREKIFLDHLKYLKHPNVQMPFAEVINWFHDKGHDFLVLPYYSSSLIQFVSVDKQDQLAANENQRSYISTILVQPKAVHKKIEPKRNLYAASPSESKTTNPEIVFQEGDLQNLKKIAFQLMSAVYILHQEGIIHADIKPENCFISIPSSSHPGSSMNGNPSLPKNPFYHPNNPRPMQSNWMGSSDNSFFSNNNTNFTGFTFLRQLPANFEVKLADFSNSIQTSEISLYYEEFAIQSAPYRAPEVLIGIPFTPSIDVWSIGIILLELCLTKAFIATDNRLEIIQLLENKIGKFSKIRFSGGKYSHVLFESKVLSSSTISFPNHSSSSSSTFTSPTMLPSSSSSSSYSMGQSNSLGSPLSSSTHPPMTSSYSMSAFQKENPNNYRIDTMKALKRLLSKTIQFDLSNYQLHQFLDFLSCLLMIDPTYRMSPKDALQHAFFTSVISMPTPLCVPFTSNENEMKKKRLRNNKNNSSSTISFASLNNSLTATPSSGASSGLSTSMNNSVGLSGSKRLLLSFDPSPARKKAATTGQSYFDLIEAKP